MQKTLKTESQPFEYFNSLDSQQQMKLLYLVKRMGDFEKGYNEFLISEFMIEKMEEENISVRELAKEAKVSPTTIQNLRSGNADSVKYKTLSNIMQKLGYALQPVKMATL